MAAGDNYDWRKACGEVTEKINHNYFQIINNNLNICKEKCMRFSFYSYGPCINECYNRKNGSLDYAFSSFDKLMVNFGKCYIACATPQDMLTFERGREVNEGCVQKCGVKFHRALKNMETDLYGMLEK